MRICIISEESVSGLERKKSVRKRKKREKGKSRSRRNEKR
jgi:hypothetical protein